jgi:4-hydroxy-tetrahydrodipicolinate synthase
MLTGSLVAIVTPMHEDGSVDFTSFRALIDWHISEGTDAICVVGTTGESPTVSLEEHCELISFAVKHSAGKIPIIAGTGANSTAEAIELAKFSKNAGADYSLTVVPYYNKPSQEGLYQHFRKIAESVDMPHILYNVPGRTAGDMTNDTVVKLTEIPNVIGIKDATGDIGRGSDLLRRVPKNFAVYSGDDATTVPLIYLGAKGGISVTANVAPKLMHEACAAALSGNIERANQLHYQLLPLHQKLFVEANPIPVKWALMQLNRIKGGIRLPLTQLSAANQLILKAAMQESKLL